MKTKPKTTFLTGLLIVMAILISCSSAGDKAEFSRAAVNDAMTSAPAAQIPDNVERKIIKTGNITFESRNVEQSMLQIRELCEKSKGIILSESSFDRDGQKGFDVTVKVPSGNFDSFTGSVVSSQDVRKVMNVRKEASDVTEEFVDVEARLKVKKESEIRLMELLKSAKNLSEVLEIEQKLSDLRAEIESIEGRLKYLNSQTEMSTVNISFYENDPYSGRFSADFWDGIKGGWQVFLLIIAKLAYLWVLIAAFILGIWGYRKYLKRNKRRRHNQNQPPAL